MGYDTQLNGSIKAEQEFIDAEDVPEDAWDAVVAYIRSGDTERYGCVPSAVFKEREGGYVFRLVDAEDGRELGLEDLIILSTPSGWKVIGPQSPS